jgi:hypothetical protein
MCRCLFSFRGRGIRVSLNRFSIYCGYSEFDGPHVVPPDLAADALNWLIR